MAEERQEEFPDIPTLKEQGIDWSIGGWVSICAPPNLPANVRTTLDSALNIATKDPDFVNALTEAGSTIRIMTGQELADFMKSEDEVNGRLMKEANLSP